MLSVHVFQLICRVWEWRLRVTVSFGLCCFFGWKNMRCRRLNIEVSIPNVGIAVTIPCMRVLRVGLPCKSACWHK